MAKSNQHRAACENWSLLSLSFHLTSTLLLQCRLQTDEGPNIIVMKNNDEYFSNANKPNYEKKNNIINNYSDFETHQTQIFWYFFNFKIWE